MKITEKILILLFIIGIILKIAAIKAGGMLCFYSGAGLFFMYFIFGFAFFNGIRFRNIFKKSSYAGIKPIYIFVAVLAGLGLGIGEAGIVFKTQIWKGADMLCETGFIFSLVVTVVSASNLRSNNAAFYKRILYRSVPILLLLVIMNIMPYKTATDLFDKYRTQHPNEYIQNN